MYRRSKYLIRLGMHRLVPAFKILESTIGVQNIGFDYRRSEYWIGLPAFKILDSTTGVQNIGFVLVNCMVDVLFFA